MPATAVAAVKTRTDALCHATSCRDEGCSLDLTGAPAPYALIQTDSEAFRVLDNQWRFPNDQQRCDYLFVGGDDTGQGPWVVPVELTTGRKETRDFLAQIRGGVLAANELLPQGIRCRFYPVGGCHLRKVGREVADELRKRSNRVNFRGQLRNIDLVECGTRLADALVE